MGARRRLEDTNGQRGGLGGLAGGAAAATMEDLTKGVAEEAAKQAWVGINQVWGDMGGKDRKRLDVLIWLTDRRDESG